MTWKKIFSLISVGIVCFWTHLNLFSLTRSFKDTSPFGSFIGPKIKYSVVLPISPFHFCLFDFSIFFLFVFLNFSIFSSFCLSSFLTFWIYTVLYRLSCCLQKMWLALTEVLTGPFYCIVWLIRFTLKLFDWFDSPQNLAEFTLNSASSLSSCLAL